MSHRSVVAIAMAVACAVATGASATAPSPDWIVVTVVADSSGADHLALRVAGIAHVHGTDPALVGFGYADRSGSIVDLAPAGEGTIQLTSTQAAGGVELTVLRGGGGRELLVEGTVLIDHLQPLERISVVIFAPGMSFDALAVEQMDVAAGSISGWSLTGSGSGVVVAAGPQDDGIGAAAGPAAVGSRAAHRRALDNGIVGGFVTSSFCVACSGTWRAPDGRLGTFRAGDAQLLGTGDGSSAFAGEGGTWTWTWSGLGLTRAGAAGTSPVLAAYAPIGDIWPLFRPLGI